jgi:hypothetical protein
VQDQKEVAAILPKIIFYYCKLNLQSSGLERFPDWIPKVKKSATIAHFVELENAEKKCLLAKFGFDANENEHQEFWCMIRVREP